MRFTSARKVQEALDVAQTATERQDALDELRRRERRLFRFVFGIVIAGLTALPLGIVLGVLGAPFGAVMPLLTVGCVALLTVLVAAVWSSNL